MAEIVLWRAADGSWAWRYRAPGQPDVVANRPFESREAALSSARRAYPGVPVRRGQGRAKRPAVPRAAFILGSVALGALVLRRRRAIVVKPVREIRLER